MSYIGNSPVVSATRTVTEFTATAGQTTFLAAAGYVPGFIDVFVNGSQLQTSDFTANDATSVVLGTACAVGDDVRLVAWGTFNSASTLNSFNPSYTGTLTGGTGVVNIGSGQVYKDASGNVGIGTTSPAKKLDVVGDFKIGTGTSAIVTFNGSSYGQIVSSPALYYDANAHYFRSGDGNSERMRIDSSGRVTMPYQPVFQAFRNSSIATANFIVYNSTWVNVGGHYNTANGRFTAPVSGVYEFSYSAIGNSVSTDVYRLSLYVNGSIYSSGGISGAQARCPSGTEYSTASATIYVSLNSGDYAQIYFTSDSGNTLYGDSSGYVRFAGRLMN